MKRMQLAVVGQFRSRAVAQTQIAGSRMQGIVGKDEHRVHLLHKMVRDVVIKGLATKNSHGAKCL